MPDNAAVQDVIFRYLDEVKERHEAASPGPWRAIPNGFVKDASGVQMETVEQSAAGFAQDKLTRTDDAVFIATARTDVPRLERMLRAAVEYLDELVVDRPDSEFGRDSLEVLEEMRRIAEGEEETHDAIL